MRRLLLLTPFLLAAACASDGYSSPEQIRSESVRPERPVPDGLVEMREGMAEMREDTLVRLDEVMGGAPEGTGYWYTPIFDALDFALSLTRLVY